ncbi:MAG: hypothetical protein ACP8RL_00265 [cyanobacterium endosymbiont of Rhopalodia inflata]
MKLVISKFCEIQQENLPENLPENFISLEHLVLDIHQLALTVTLTDSLKVVN